MIRRVIEALTALDAWCVKVADMGRDIRNQTICAVRGHEWLEWSLQRGGSGALERMCNRCVAFGTAEEGK